MPVRKVKDPTGKGRECYQWGHTGRVYCGAGARARAEKQGVAVRMNQAKEGKKVG